MLWALVFIGVAAAASPEHLAAPTGLRVEGLRARDAVLSIARPAFSFVPSTEYSYGWRKDQQGPWQRKTSRSGQPHGIR
mgnify:CR=1 FL=1